MNVWVRQEVKDLILLLINVVFEIMKVTEVLYLIDEIVEQVEVIVVKNVVNNFIGIVN